MNETLVYALRTAGATEIYQVGGAQAIAALAYGTNTIARVCKIFGPGNAYVVEAKRQVVGACAIDQLPGPSEIAIVADETANPAFIRCRPARAGRAWPRQPGATRHQLPQGTRRRRG